MYRNFLGEKNLQNFTIWHLKKDLDTLFEIFHNKKKIFKYMLFPKQEASTR